MDQRPVRCRRKGGDAGRPCCQLEVLERVLVPSEKLGGLCPTGWPMRYQSTLCARVGNQWERGLRSTPLQEAIEAEPPSSGRSKVQIDKAVEHGYLAFVLNDPEPLWGMGHKVGHRHLS